MYHEYAVYFDQIFPVKPACLKFLVTRSSHGKVLDVGCGSGDMALALAKQGMHVVGIDLDHEMIETAKQKSTEEERVTFTQADMLTFHEGSYSLIYCIGNTLVHLHDLKQMSTFIKHCYEMLEPNGQLVIQIVNYDRILKDKVTSLPTIKNNELTFVRDYEHVNGKIRFKTQLITPDKTFANEVELYPLVRSELEGLLAKAGFEEVCAYGGFDGSEWQPDSFPLIVTAVRR